MSWDTGVSCVLSLVSAPEKEPITLTEAKRQVRRETVNDDDPYLESICIKAARDRAELATGRQLITATWDLKLSRFPIGCRYIELPRPPLQSVTYVQYVDEDGATQTFSSSDYSVDAPAGPTAARGRINLNYDEVWPSTRWQANAVTIRFVSGYGNSAYDVPARLKMGMLMDIGTLYEIREDYIIGQGYTVSPVPIGSERIYQSFKSWPRG